MSVWGTGGRPPRAEAFLGRRDHRISGHQGPHHHASPHAAPGFAWGRGRTLDQGKPPPRPATRPRHSMRSTPGRHARTRTSPTNPKEGRIRWKHAIGQGTADRSCGRYGNIDPFIHSTTPVGLALGPDSPRDDERGPGTLGHPAARILTLLSLLMSAFSLPYGPPQDHSAASTRHGTLSYPTTTKVVAASSVACLSPATLSARNH